MRDQQHRKYPEEFELEALRRLATSGKSAAQSEREPGITEGMLLKQRERYQVIQPEEGQASLEPSDNERSPNCSKKTAFGHLGPISSRSLGLRHF